MRKVLVFLLGILIISVLGHYSLPKVYAVIAVEQKPDPVCQDSKEYTMIFKGAKDEFIKNEDYSLRIWKYKEGSNDLNNTKSYIYPYKSTDGKILTQVRNPTTRETTITIVGQTSEIGRWHYKLWFGKGFDTFKTEPDSVITSGNYTMYPKETCVFGLPVLEMSSPVRITDTVPIKVRNINPDSEYLLWFIDGQTFNNGKFPDNSITTENGISTASFSVTLDNKPGTKTLCLKHGSTTLRFGKDNCEISIPIEVTIEKLQGTPTIIRSGEVGAPLEESDLFLEEPTYDVPPPPCATLAPDGKCLNVNTAIGLISTDPQTFVKSIFSLVLGMAGGIALILIMISGYKFMASGGNPEATKAATEQLTSAIIGLLFIIFSFVILQVIGVDILRIPGFNP